MSRGTTQFGQPSQEKAALIRAAHAALVKVVDGQPILGLDVALGLVRAWVYQCAQNRIGIPPADALNFASDNVLQLEQELTAHGFLDDSLAELGDVEIAVVNNAVEGDYLACPTCQALVSVSFSGGLACRACEKPLRFPPEGGEHGA